MFTTKQAIKMLINRPIGLAFIMNDDQDIHIFKDVNGDICRGIYGDGSIIKINHGSYKNNLWIIDFKGSKFRQ